MTGARSRFVGRDADARDLRRMIEGRPTLVLVQGDAGVGKSRLLAETLADGGSDHLIGACLPLRRQMALLPFREMFGTGRPDVRRRVTRSLGSLPPGLVQGLDGVLPEQVLANAGRAPE